MNKYKKILLGVVAGAAMLTATVLQVNAINPAWQLNPATMYAIDFACTAGCSGTHNHTMDVTSYNTTTGNFTATGFYTTLPQYSWTANGNISNSNLTMTIVYDGTSPLPGYTVTMAGAISSGAMSGTATSTNSESFNWTIMPNASPLTPPLTSPITPTPTVTVTPTITATPTPTGNPYAVPTACSGISGLGSPMVGTNGSDDINGTSGNDLIFALGGSDDVDGKGGNDCIVGGAGSDDLRGGQGMDVLLGGAGADDLNGGQGIDALYGEAGTDDLQGGSENDELWGGAGTDSLEGGSGNDKLYGNEGTDSLRGDAGNDTLDGGAGNDDARGGAGTDTCSAESESQCEL